MIYGVGVDIEDVNRIKAVITGRERFIERFFSKSEIEMFVKKNFNPETVCGNFCAKEAFVKALGIGFRDVTVKDIEEDEILVLHIVGSKEVNVDKNKISDESPIGKALMGHTKGETVEVEAPMGTFKLEIIDIGK